MLALGLVGSPGIGLRPGPFDKKGPSAFTLLEPSCTPRTLPPHPGDTPATRSTSMILLTGRLLLPRALPPVTGRREAVICLAQSGLPKPMPPHHPCSDTKPTPDKVISSHGPGQEDWEGQRALNCPHLQASYHDYQEPPQVLLLIGHLMVSGSDSRQCHTVPAGRVMNHRSL